MHDAFYPSVDLAFIESEIINSGKVIDTSKIKVGNTTVFVLIAERKAMYKRLIVLRELTPNEISFEMATGLAINLKFMGNLLRWLEENRNWKDGAYCESHNA